MIRLFGIRHHGPGCARSLRQALDAWQPDCILVEGPPEADAIVPLVADPQMVPPVALLVHCPDEPGLASFYPLAEFSPEWQALQWACRQGVAVRFMDLPVAHDLGLRAQAAAGASEAAAGHGAGAAAEEPESSAQVAPPSPQPSPASGRGSEPGKSAGPAAVGSEPGESGAGDDPGAAAQQARDPLGWLAQAAGYGDGESWWNHMVEERGDGEDLFAAIAEAMGEVRSHAGDAPGRDAARERLREAHMRQSIREARKENFQRIAVVCGAWHVPALDLEAPQAPTARADAQALKGLPKRRVAATWVPWTYRHLATASGYGAGIASPGWYEFLWQQPPGSSRAAGWLARVARLLREEDIDCSSAHVIEGIRLADTLAALRERPAPGLPELQEASLAVLCQGEAAPLTLVAQKLVVGERMGQVPEGVPAVPLQRDIEQAQKSLRLKPEALAKTLELDLRKDNDLARSRLLHRLALLQVPWGRLARSGQASRGTFREAWQLQWEPAFAMAVIEASRWGSTVADAAAAAVIEQAQAAQRLAELSTLMDQALLADLPQAVPVLTRALEERAALTGDAAQLLEALPPLANAFRYGTVRRTDGALVAHLLDGMVGRAAIGLALACTAIDDAAADHLRGLLLAADQAVVLRGDESVLSGWRQALRQVATGERPHPLVRGTTARLLLDAAVLEAGEAAVLLSRNLSAGVPPLEAAAWLDGFLNRNAMVLLHDDVVWPLVDDWLGGLGPEHFLAVLPLLRRTFSAFAAGERRDLAARARRVAGPATAATQAWDEERALLPLPLLRTLLGVPA